MAELQHGMRVRIKGTMFYNGRLGTLKPTSTDPEDIWDFYVDLDAQELAEGEPMGFETARTIGVTDFQVEPV